MGLPKTTIPGTRLLVGCFSIKTFTDAGTQGHDKGGGCVLADTVRMR